MRAHIVGAWLGLAFTLAGCAAYEYEEEVVLGVDGSGSLRVSGSSEMLEAVHALDDASDLGEVESLFRAPPLELDSIRQTARDGRTFVHVQGTFADWNELCGHPAFRDRDCRLTRADGTLSLYTAIATPGTLPEGVPADGPVALRIHFPSKVSFHNSATGVERGNIIRWEREASEHVGGPELIVEARFVERSVLATTIVVFGGAFAIVVVTVGVALFWLVRKGRRQLAEDAG